VCESHRRAGRQLGTPQGDAKNNMRYDVSVYCFAASRDGMFGPVCALEINDK
jgi:hypothetical protein